MEGLGVGAPLEDMNLLEEQFGATVVRVKREGRCEIRPDAIQWQIVLDTRKRSRRNEFSVDGECRWASRGCIGRRYAILDAVAVWLGQTVASDDGPKKCRGPVLVLPTWNALRSELEIALSEQANPGTDLRHDFFIW